MARYSSSIVSRLPHIKKINEGMEDANYVAQHLVIKAKMFISHATKYSKDHAKEIASKPRVARAIGAFKCARRFLKNLKKTRKEKKVEDKDALWKRAVLMGMKCDPLEFSGVIHYDSDGNQVFELPARKSLVEKPK